jgi:hypothetical protein
MIRVIFTSNTLTPRIFRDREIGLSARRTGSTSHNPPRSTSPLSVSSPVGTAWYRKGADVQRLLPVLSTYLGHADLEGTKVYLSMTPELLQHASLRFADDSAIIADYTRRVLASQPGEPGEHGQPAADARDADVDATQPMPTQKSRGD